MTDLEIKEAVRERDGYKCRDCGMTSEDHVSQTGRELDVHRLFPGAQYDKKDCVTLCRACHGKKPKNIADYVFSDNQDIVFVFWNRYDPQDRVLLAQLETLAQQRGEDLCSLVDSILSEGIQARLHSQLIQECAQADGLW